MAKGKNAAALFEVIHSSKNPGLLRTPRWWFKGRPSPLNGSTDPGHVPDSAPASHQAVTSYDAPPSELPRTHVHLDRYRKEFTMRMRTSTALVGGFALAVAVALAYVVGQHVAGGPKSATASDVTTDEIRQQPAAPATLDVPRRAPRQTPQSPTIKTGATGPNVVVKRNDTGSRRGDTASPPATGNVYNPEQQIAAIGPRLIGKNYILVASYPPNKLDDAQKLSDVLGNAGVPCSIEKVPKDYYNPDGKWVSVITRQGFVGKSDRECKECLRAITEATEPLRKAKKLPSDGLAVFQWK
jgi:hypothetical protein